MSWWHVLWYLLPMQLFAQTSTHFKLVDELSGDALPYAPVSYLGTGKGTLTNEDGAFSLPDRPISDSIRIAYVGYHTLILAWAELPARGVIRMRPSLRLLKELTVKPGEPQYARVMAAARWMNRAPRRQARLFFDMETRSDSMPVEILHAFYNLRTRAGHIENLELKQGRIGITEKNGRFFINYNTTRAFALMDPLAQNSFFPSSPLACNGPREMRRLYTATLVSSSEGLDPVEHIQVRPRATNPQGFTLDLWMQKDKDRVVALELACTDCPRQPFVPLFEHGHIDSVDLRFRQTWTTEGGPMPELFQLEYRMSYTGPDFSDAFTTQAVMHAYDRNNPFIPLMFEFTGDPPDYRKLAWLPNDTAFWQRNPTPLPSERQRSEGEFLEKNDLRTSNWYLRLGNDQNFFGSHYAIWSPEHRVTLNAIASSPSLGTFERVRVSEWTGRHALYQGPRPLVLVAQLMLDLDTTNGTLTHRTFTVLDGYQSYDLLVVQPWTMAFHNIWFDLCEMERRALEEDLNAPGVTVARAREFHKEHMARLKAMTDRLLTSTRYAEDLEALRPWNEQVKGSLGIDNLGIFGVK